MAIKKDYKEPADYFSKEIRKKYGLGEFNPEYIAKQKAKEEKAEHLEQEIIELDGEWNRMIKEIVQDSSDPDDKAKKEDTE